MRKVTVGGWDAFCPLTFPIISPFVPPELPPSLSDIKIPLSPPQHQTRLCNYDGM